MAPWPPASRVRCSSDAVASSSRCGPPWEPPRRVSQPSCWSPAKRGSARRASWPRQQAPSGLPTASLPEVVFDVAAARELLPFAPIIEALRGLARSLPEAELNRLFGPGRADLAPLLPQLRRDPTDGDGTGLAYGSAQGRLFEAVLGLLDRLTATGPVVLVVEDMHWADRSTLDLLAFLVRNLRQGPMLLLRTFLAAAQAPSASSPGAVSRRAEARSPNHAHRPRPLRPPRGGPDERPSRVGHPTGLVERIYSRSERSMPETPPQRNDQRSSPDHHSRRFSEARSLPTATEPGAAPHCCRGRDARPDGPAGSRRRHAMRTTTWPRSG